MIDTSGIVNLNKKPSFNLSFKLLVSDVLLSGLLGNLGDVSLHVSNPLAGVSSPLLADSLVLSTAFLSDLLLSGLTSLLVDSAGSFPNESGVRVEGVKGLCVGQGVRGLPLVEDSVFSGVSDGALNFVGVDDAGDVRVGDLVGRKSPALLLGASLLVSSEDVVKLLEGAFGPDDESSDVSSGGELKEVQSADVGDLNSGDVSKGLDQGDVGTAVDDQRSSSASVSSVSELSAASSDLDGINDLLDISPSSSILEESDGLSGAFDLFSGVSDNEGEFGDSVNSVSSGLDKREDSGGSQGGGDSVSLLLEVASSVPSSPDSDGGKHSSLSAHVSEGTLAIAGGT